MAIAGKIARRSFDSSMDKPAIHMVSAWANRNRLLLAPVKVEEKSKEIEAIGTQKKIAQRIREGKAERPARERETVPGWRPKEEPSRCALRFAYHGGEGRRQI